MPSSTSFLTRDDTVVTDEGVTNNQLFYQLSDAEGTLSARLDVVIAVGEVLAPRPHLCRARPPSCRNGR